MNCLQDAMRDPSTLADCGTTCSLGSDREALTEQELCLRMELQKQRNDMLLKQIEARKRREVMEAQHMEVCEELNTALAAQVAIGSRNMQPLNMARVQDLVRREAQMRHDITLMKDDLLKLQSYQQQELDNMDIVHRALCQKLGKESTSKLFLEPVTQELYPPAVNYTHPSAAACVAPPPTLSYSSQSQPREESPKREWSSSPLIEQAKARQVKYEVDQVKKRVQGDTDLIKRDRSTSPLKEQVKARQVKHEVGETLKRIHAGTEKIKRDRQMFTAGLEDINKNNVDKSGTRWELDSLDTSADRVPFAAAGLRIRCQDGRLLPV